MAGRPLLSLFGRGGTTPAPEPAAKLQPLPELVRDALDNASVMFRAGTGDDAKTDRAIVQLPGFTGFIWSPEAAAKVIGRAWPELDDCQTRRAVRRLGQTVTTRLAQHTQGAANRQAVLDGTAPDCRPWMSRY